MAKGGGKLMKLKSVLKKWNSFGTNTTNKQSRGGATVSAVANDEQSSVSGPDFRAVYVGKTWRRYWVSPDVVEHPLFRELVDRSRESYDDNNLAVVEEDTVHVACEVVLFEHLIWMLENADPQPDSLDELAIAALMASTIIYFCMAVRPNFDCDCNIKAVIAVI
ncbi:hypothetical protein PIB30_060042 [Stylosanthes scabra]|uniref:Uncharacterized protein n=1 Tax=Stylosanthes scabra TaxID=79078 RepID=A0ABU6WKG4_9FABA|nr:hypothetical protein [Stylosanthes scabra]